MWKSLAASAAMIVLFFVGWPVQKVAFVTGALLLITRRVRPEKVYAHVDWPLLVMFAGLFVVVAGMERSQLEAELKAFASAAHMDNIWTLTAISAVLSNIVSNVPAVVIFKPFMAHLADPLRAWLTLAMSSTLAGNLTVLGSVANLIVLQRARDTVRIGFWEYARAGVPLTIASLAVGALILSFNGR
jgi:Na+/H+ antiporter NhaD/arsenite permease-like protein